MSEAYPNCSMCSEDLIPDDGELCGACARAVSETAKELIAAAEERGRRAGIEERDELLGRARDWLQFMAAHPSEGDAKNLIARIDAALAPRDSGKEIERIRRMEDGLAAAPGVVGGAVPKTTVTLPDTPCLTALKALVDAKDRK